jgi:glutaredoxin 3
MVKRAGRTSVPQIFIDGHHVGGSDDLITTDESGRLNWLLRIGTIRSADPKPAAA